MVKHVPDGFRSVTPHLVVNDGAKALDFYQKAFGAEEIVRMESPGGGIMHAEIKIGDSVLMLASEFPDWGVFGPKHYGGSGVTIHLYVKDCDAAIKRAEKAGCTVTMPAEDQFWGDRYGKLQDPFGHNWSIATHIEDVSPEECRERAAKMFGGCC
jgi:uncharacterized glyoxalase superfamily protein PhnB